MRNAHYIRNQKVTKKSNFLYTTALMAAGMLVLPNAAQAQVDNYADWDDVTITHGNANVQDTGLGTTTIEQHSARAVGEAQELHIGQMGNVTINQDSNDALFVGRVIGDHDDPTQILGQLSANGRVMIIDRNGVFFGEGSRVDAAGVTIATGDVADDQIMSGDESFTFEDFGKGEIVLNGTINVTDAGLAAFVSPTVKNNGVIRAKMGNVVMAAGEKVTLDLYGDGLVEVAVEGELENALLENKGVIEAEGGTVNLSAAMARGVVDTVINNEGLISASSATVEGGKIILSGGEGGAVNVSGTLDASGAAQGGEISVTGKRVNIAQSGKLINKGNAGKAYVYGKEKTTFKGKLAAGKNSTSEISGHDLELGGEIELGEGSTLSFDPVNLTVGAGEAATFVSALNNNGVTVNVEAQNQITVNADINSSAQTTNSTLNFRDENADNNLQVDLNARITLGANQNLTGEATTVNVNGSAALIQNGVDVAASGANVNVAAGNYNDSVNLHKAIILSGANAGVHGNGARGAESTVNANAGSPGFLVTAHDVTIDGFEIVGGNTGVYVQNSNNATVQNNDIHGQFDVSAEGNSFGGLATGDGIFVQNSSGTRVLKNLVHDYNDDGIHAYNVSNITIIGNGVQDNGNGDEGIAVSNAVGVINVINNNLVNARRDGIQISDVSGTTTVTGNKIDTYGHAGVSFVNVQGGTFIDNNIMGGGVFGIDVVNSRDVVIGDTDDNNNSGNTILNTGTGVKVSSSYNVFVQDNSITGVTTGIYVNDSDAIVLQANEINASGNGIRFVNGINNNKRIHVYDNNITAGLNGILIQGGISSGSIVNLGTQNLGNTIVAGSDDIRVEGEIVGSRLRVTDSTITGGNDGIEIQGIGNDGVASIWFNRSIVGNAGSGVEIGHVTTATSGSGLTVPGNGLIEGVLHDGLTIGSVTGANVAIVGNESIRGRRHGINFVGVLDNANVLIGDGGFVKTGSNVYALNGAGIHFDKDVNNSTVTIGSGSLSTTTVAATTTYNSVAIGGVNIQSSNDGIGFENTLNNSDVVITANRIDAGDNGMEFLSSVTDSNITVAGNQIFGGNDGIDFDSVITNSHIIIGSALGYLGNLIHSDQSGIEFGKQLFTYLNDSIIDILGNTVASGIHGVSFVGGNISNGTVNINNNDIIGRQRGISVSNGDLSNGTVFNILDNTRIRGITRDGVFIQDLAFGGATVNIAHTGVPIMPLGGGISAGEDGIDLRDIETINVTNNTIHDTGVDGIRIIHTSNANVSGNSIQNSGAHGIDLRNAALANLSANGIYDNGLSGIYLLDSSNVTISDSKIDGNQTGLTILGSNTVNVIDNLIAHNLLYGLHADGTGNGAITLAGNTFLDNPVGARFESGQIDISNLLNPNTFTLTAAIRSVGPYVGMQFDGAPTLLTIFNETLGATIFSGYGLRAVGGAYYVRFENGSILNTATLEPIVIDGDFANWDGLVPNVFGGGFLASVERQNIEDRLFDADDAVVDGRGQIFADVVIPPTPDNPDGNGDLGQVEDFFRRFLDPEDQSNRASLRVLGLPPISLPGTFNEASLNALTPAAGGEDGTTGSLADIAPAAGGDQEAAAVEPAAGGANDQQVTCWGDAMNSLENGAVTYNFGGTFEESIAAESGCQSSEQI